MFLPIFILWRSLVDFEIISLNSSNFLHSIENGLDKKIIIVESGNFADSEYYIKPPDISIKDKEAFVIHRFSFENKSINNQILELLFLTDLIKKLGAKKIRVILPYLPYSRQAKNFGTQLVGPINLIGKLFQSSSVDEVISFELHEGLIKKIFSIPLTEISLINFGGDFFNTHRGILFESKNVCFVSPDEGRAKFIEKIAKIADKPFAYIKKERKGNNEAVAKELIGSVNGMDVIIIDDIIDTGNTAISACDMVLNSGAKSVVGFFAHPVLSRDSIDKLNKSRFKKIFITDTVLVGDKLKSSIDNKIQQVSIVGVLVEFFQKTLV